MARSLTSRNEALLILLKVRVLIERREIRVVQIGMEMSNPDIIWGHNELHGTMVREMFLASRLLLILKQVAVVVITVIERSRERTMQQ